MQPLRKKTGREVLAEIIADFGRFIKIALIRCRRFGVELRIRIV
jgi:hypothetical protein